MLPAMQPKSLLDQCVCTPGSFAGLMAIYEQNYKYICELLDDLDIVRKESVSRIPAHLPLRLKVLERFRYTTTLSLTYLFRESGIPQTDPDIVVRVYHDAEVAEVLGVGEAAHSYSAPSSSQPVDGWVLERKWQLNRFLEKWLEYCLACGHRFSAEHSEPAL